MNNEFFEKREIFAMFIANEAKRLGLPPDQVVDSFLTIIVGIYLGSNLEFKLLEKRVKVAWEDCKKLFIEMEMEDANNSPDSTGQENG